MSKEIDLFAEVEDPVAYAEAFEGNVIKMFQAMKHHGEGQLNEPYHRFAPGVYARELFIPAGQMIVGKPHKTEHLNIISGGTISYATVDGFNTVSAPYTFTSKAGIQKVVYAHTDTTWTTIHPTDETDLVKLEHELVDPSAFLAKADYQEFLLEEGFTEEFVRGITEIDVDLIDMPEGYEHLQVMPSEIEGNGLFTSKDIKQGEIIGEARIDGHRTPLGRYVNHSNEPNAEFVKLENGDMQTRAIRDIMKGTEITQDYRQGAAISKAEYLEYLGEAI